jgi:hypothetical protein
MAVLDYLDVDLADWRTEGAGRLDRQILRARHYEHYYDGLIASRLLSGDQRDIFRQLVPASRTNWSELTVNAVAERMLVVGFRFGGSSDDLAWTIWQASAMDSLGEMVQTDALVCGHTFVSVWPEEANPTGVQIIPEHPSQITLLYRAPNGHRRTVAAYKRVAEGAMLVEQLITPDQVVTWTRELAAAPDDSGALTFVGEPSGDPESVEANPTRTVPVVELAPAPRTVGPPRSELHSVIPIQDRINLEIYNRLVASDFGAFRQVTATGVKAERGPEGEYIAPFNVGADRLLTSENPDARFGVIQESTLKGYLDSVEADVQHLAAITQTPPHYLLGGMVNISGEALKAAEAGLVAKVRRRASHLGEGWESVQRLGLAMVGDPGAVNVSGETIWRDFETRSEGELVDALVKMRTLGVPRKVLWERWGASPQEIARWEQLAAAEAAADAAVSAAALGATDPYAALLGGGTTSPPPTT